MLSLVLELIISKNSSKSLPSMIIRNELFLINPPHPSVLIFCAWCSASNKIGVDELILQSKD